MTITTAQRRVLREIADRNDGSVGSASSRTLILLVENGLVEINQRTGAASLTERGRALVTQPKPQPVPHDESLWI